MRSTTDSQNFKSTFNVLAEHIDAAYAQFPEALNILGGEPFKVVDTGIHPKVIADWNRHDLLLRSPEKNRMHRFSLTEFVWVKLIEKMRAYNYPLESILKFKQECILIERKEREELLNDPQLFDALIEKFGEGDRKLVEAFLSQSEGVKAALSALPVDLMTINQLDGMIIFCLMAKHPLSIMISENGEVFYFSSAFLNHPELDQSELLKTMDRSHMSISLTEVLTEVVSLGPLEKLSGELRVLTPSETEIMKALEEEDVVSLTVRKDKAGKMDFLEITKLEKVDKKARLMELILTHGYQNIELKTADGKVVLCKNTRKLKLK